MPLAPSWRDLLGTEGRWVLAVDWYERGTVYFSEVGFVLGTDAGDVIVEGGLGEITLGRVAASPEVRVVVDSDRVDWLSSWRRGLFLERIPARLYRWHTGDDLEDARLVVEGYLGDVAVADPTARDRLSAVLRPLDLVTGDLLPSLTVTKASIPSLSFIINSATTDDGPSLGASRPEVFGRPGYPTGQPAIPALELTLTDDTIADFKSPGWLLCGHTVRAANCLLWDVTDFAVSVVEGIVQTQDEQGRTFSAAADTGNPWSPLTDERVNSGRSFWWGLASPAEGRSNPYRTGDLRGLSDVLRYLYERVGGRKVDTGRMETYAAELNKYQIDAVLTEPTEIGAWIEGEILRVYPVRIIQGPQGLYCRRRTFRATEADAVATLSTRGGGILVAATSPLSPVAVTLASRVRVSYAYRTLSTYQESVTVGVTPGDAAETTTTGVLAEGGAHWAEIVEPYVGTVEAVIEVPTTWDRATAQRLALDYLDAQSLPRHRRLYEGGVELEGLALGDVVRLDDPDLNPDEVLLATVEEIEVGGPSVRVTLEILRGLLLYDVPTS
jgi:hypothetical protein